MKLIFNKTHLETESAYVCSKEQARAILARRKRKYTQDTHLAGDLNHTDLKSKPVRYLKTGIRIGCQKFSNADIRLVQKWLHGEKVIDKLA